MAEPQLNFDESSLDHSTGLYELYSRFYEGMKNANQCDAPDYVTNPPLTETGEVDVDAIADGLASHSDIQMKNAAYMMANAIMLSIDGEGGGEGGSGGGRYVMRTGDSMTGKLSALYGFMAGQNGELILETIISSQKPLAHIHGYVTVDKDMTIQGILNLSDNGVYFSDKQAIFYKDKILSISADDIELQGNVEIKNQLTIGKVVIKNDSIFNDNNEYYHAGNSNNSVTDWNMCDAHVYGNAVIEGTSMYKGRLTALYGFDLGEDGSQLLYSRKDTESSSVYIQLATDLALTDNFGVTYAGTHIVKVSGNTVRILAPGKVLSIGGTDGTATQYISLQSAIKNDSGDYDIITQYGDGNFKNSFSAGCGNAMSAVMSTYCTTSTDCGVVFYRNIRIGDDNGPIICTNDNKAISFVMPYIHNVNNLPQTDMIPLSIDCRDTNSPFQDQSKEWSASLNFHTDAEFFAFRKPVESASFSIISEKYKTRLIENTLFLDDGVFIEGLSDGVRVVGNTYFTGNVSSMQYASGFAGYGWAIIQSELAGGFAATFDELTVRKKMRVYELEVQKHSITNGSLWVSDACSGDLVEEIL